MAGDAERAMVLAREIIELETRLTAKRAEWDALFGERTPYPVEAYPAEATGKRLIAPSRVEDILGALARSPVALRADDVAQIVSGDTLLVRRSLVDLKRRRGWVSGPVAGRWSLTDNGSKEYGRRMDAAGVARVASTHAATAVVSEQPAVPTEPIASEVCPDCHRSEPEVKFYPGALVCAGCKMERQHKRRAAAARPPEAPSSTWTCARCGQRGHSARSRTCPARALAAPVASEPPVATPEPPTGLDPVTSHGVHAASARVVPGENTLVRQNMGLVHLVARRWKSSPMAYEDLVQEGTMGLLHAIRTFDPNRGAKLATHAVWQITAAISRAHANTARLIRMPVHAVDALSRLRRAGRDGLPDGVSARTAAAIDGVRAIVSLDAPIVADGSVVLGDVLAAPEPSNEERDTLALRAEIEEALAALTPREQDVIRTRWLGEHTLIETASMVGSTQAARAGKPVSRERVRQIETRALRKLRHELG